MTYKTIIIFRLIVNFILSGENALTNHTTRGGKLEVFERVDFDSLFKE